MAIYEMLNQSGVMAMVGMGIVFSFLLIMVIAVSLMSKIIKRFEKNEAAVPAYCAAGVPGNDANITAAISAAVNEYRKNK